MRALTCLLLALLGALTTATSPAAQPADSIAVAGEVDLIAVFSEHVERRLLRVRFDRAAGKADFSPFGPVGIETFAVGPNGAFVAYAVDRLDDASPIPHVLLLDAAGRPSGKPVASPIGKVVELAVSPEGDWVAASGERGWISLFAVDRSGPTVQLAARATFGVSANRAFSWAFRPDGGLVTITDDWVMVHRAPEGAIQRVLDLKTVNRSLSPIDLNGLFRLRWSPRGDHFAVNWGGGPMFTKLFDASGRLLQPAGSDTDLPGTDVTFIDDGDAAIVFGMTTPTVIRLTGSSLASRPFGDREINVAHLVVMAGGRRIATFDGSRVGLLSGDGTPLIAPSDFENYSLEAVAAGAEDEAIVSATRDGWIDLFTKMGEFRRRFQSGARGTGGPVALSADGSVIAVLGASELVGVSYPAMRTWTAPSSARDDPDQYVAVAANGSRVAAAGAKTLRSWSSDGKDAMRHTLAAEGQTPPRLVGLAVSPAGDTIVVGDESLAAWVVRPADTSVRRVALPAPLRTVVPLPQGGFAIGLKDGTIVRLGRDGVLHGEPIRGAEFGGVGLIAPSDDGRSFMVVEEDEMSARHLDWNGRVLAGPYRTIGIKRAFFDGSRAMLIVSQDKSNELAGDHLALRELAASPASGIRYFEPPR